MGLFHSSKDKSEHKDTADIKQAAISDSQMNSIQNNPPAQQQNTMPSQNQLNTNQLQNSQSQNFVNPFAQQQNASFSQNPRETTQIQQEAASGTDFNDVLGQQQNAIYQQSQQNHLGQQGDMAEQHLNLSSMSNHNSSAVDFDKIQEMIDETVEKVIEDKWNMLEDKVNKVLRWKENKDAEINMLKEDLVALGEGFNKLEMKLINKISNYDKNILDVNSEIKALEKVFQKVTPTLINNVNELSKIADEFKGIKPKERKVMTEDDFSLEDIKEEQKENSSKK